METLYQRIEDLCTRNKITITDMCKESGASRGSLTDLKMGRKQSLSSQTLSKIASYFNVTVDYLLTGEQKEKPAEKFLDELIKDEPMAAYDNLKEHLTEADKEDIAQLIRIRAELNQNKKG